MGRVKLKRPEKSLIITGLCGVGKTVLLNEINRMARAEDYHGILLEARDDKTLGDLLYPALRTLLFDLDRIAKVGNKVNMANSPSRFPSLMSSCSTRCLRERR